MKTLRSLIAGGALLATAVASPLAAAHAVLKASEPQSGAVLAAPPQHIVLTFNEKIEPAFTSVTVSNAKGDKVSAGKAVPDAGNPAAVKLAVPALGAGAYTVKWAVAGHDGHRRTGEFKFTVK
ncbi:copper resistance CopC family protein [Pseudoduganella sp. OTU4001]|uniref:copper resistance CopC family protein n=1 Tax=Pseudoduganella sp. OTU4001 TaxID=3043854 RepID=UPI00313C25F2